jgi:hypothetical protein
MKLLLLLSLATASYAHFTYILPLPGEKGAEMILGETPSTRDTVNPSIAAGAQLFIRDASGAVTSLKMELDGYRFVLPLPGAGDRVVYGSANLGVAQRGKDAKPHLLLYYPKTILGNPFAPSATVGGEQAVELIPQGQPGNLHLRFLAHGAPVPNAEIVVTSPDGEQHKVKTNQDGIAGPFSQHGRYGAWARFWEDKPGQHAGKDFQQTRHYAILVFDSLAAPLAAPPLPEKTSSFGAAVEDGWLYVYGGHIARTHSYSTEAVSGRFSRRPLAGGPWEELPSATPLQGLNLAATAGRVCRAGGMQPRNAAGQKADNHSVDEVACFSTSSRSWQALPPLPSPRSSHDLAIAANHLIVTGGWHMRGAESSIWAKTTLLLDLANPAAGWREVPQPFERRALVSAVWNGRVYVIGGITPTTQVSSDVDVFNPASNSWSKGPALPGSGQTGFAPAAAVLDGKLYASTGDGALYVLDSSGANWQRIARTSQRLAHRMVPAPGSLVLLGGAAKGGNLDLVETVAVR